MTKEETIKKDAGHIVQDTKMKVTYWNPDTKQFIEYNKVWIVLRAGRKLSWKRCKNPCNDNDIDFKVPKNYKLQSIASTNYNPFGISFSEDITILSFITFIFTSSPFW